MEKNGSIGIKKPASRVFFWYLIILLAAILGQDILLEPFAAEAFGMPVKDTTRITSIWGVCVLAALLVAGMLEGRADKRRVAAWGGGSAVVGFVIISLSGVILNQGIFYGGVVLLGLGTGLSTVSNLSLMLDMTTGGKVGLFIGTWGMANAISRLLGSVLGGIVRDIISEITQNAVLGYVYVFGIMVLMLLMSLLMLGKIDTSAFRAQVEEPSFIERASVAVDV